MEQAAVELNGWNDGSYTACHRAPSKSAGMLWTFRASGSRSTSLRMTAVWSAALRPDITTSATGLRVVPCFTNTWTENTAGWKALLYEIRTTSARDAASAAWSLLPGLYVDLTPLERRPAGIPRLSVRGSARTRYEWSYLGAPSVVFCSPGGPEWLPRSVENKSKPSGATYCKRTCSTVSDAEANTRLHFYFFHFFSYFRSVDNSAGWRQPRTRRLFASLVHDTSERLIGRNIFRRNRWVVACSSSACIESLCCRPADPCRAPCRQRPCWPQTLDTVPRQLYQILLAAVESRKIQGSVRRTRLVN